MNSSPESIASRNKAFWTESVSGDEILCLQRDKKMIFAVIDGTGHGVEAHEASTRVAQLIEKYIESYAPDELLRKVHQVMSPSIGASVALAVIEGQQLSVAGVGNISTYVLGEVDHSFACGNGAIGAQLRNVLVQRHTLKAGDVIVMHSDGIKSRFYTQYQPEILKKTAEEILSYVFSHFAKQHDDASCIVHRF